MTETFVCGECELEQPMSVHKKTVFAFPASGHNGLEVITVNVDLCTSCFMNGGLSTQQQNRIRERVIAKIKKKPLEGG